MQITHRELQQTHIHIHTCTQRHTQYSLCFFFFTVVWLWPCPLLVQHSDYCSRSVCALAVMWSLWRLAIVWPKTIFVVAQPLRTGLGQRDQTWQEPRMQKINGHFCPRLLFTVQCVSDSKMVLVWCFFSVVSFRSFITDTLFSLQIDKDVKKKEKRKKLWFLLEKAFYLSCMLMCR